MALNGSNSEGMHRYVPGGLGAPSPMQDRRRRGKPPGSYYGGPGRNDGRTYQGGYQPRRPLPPPGGNGDGPHNGVYHRSGGDYSTEGQSQSPESHGSSGRSAQGSYPHPFQGKEYGGDYRPNQYRHDQGSMGQQGSGVTGGIGSPPGLGQPDLSGPVSGPSASQEGVNMTIGGPAHFQLPQPPPTAPPMLAPFAAPAPASMPMPTAPLGFYGYHPSSQPVMGVLALCHIPFGINPSSVISPVVYTQIIGSGMLSPGLPYNLSCAMPSPFLQPPPPSAPLLIQPPPPPQPPQSYQYHPQFQHHQAAQYTMPAPQPQVVVHHSNPVHHSTQPLNQSTTSGHDDGVSVFDSSSLLNPDADAFFPPTFPPSGETSSILNDTAREEVVPDADNDQDARNISKSASANLSTEKTVKEADEDAK